MPVSFKGMMQKVASVVTLGYVSNIDSDADLDSVVQYQANGETRNAGMYMPYGLSANIPKGATLVLLSNNGSSQNRVAYGSFPENRFRDLKEWELKIGNYKTKACIFFDEDGGVTVRAGKDGGKFRFENDNGFFEMSEDGVFNANDNFWVEP